MSQRFQSCLRWLMLVVLMVFAMDAIKDLDWNLPMRWDATHLWLSFAICCLLAHGTQAWMTSTVVACCQSKLSWVTALQINVIGGLWGMFVPMGSVGYKALYLKREQGLSVLDYGRWYLLATLSNGLLGLNLLACCWWKVYPWLCLSLIMVVFTLGVSRKRLPDFLKAKLGLDQVHSEQNFFALMKIQGVGFVVYTCLYMMATELFGYSIPVSHALTLVVFQSWLFLVPIVPGNLVILESMVASVLQMCGLPLEISIAVSLLNRVAMVVTLCLMAPWAVYHLPKPSELKGEMSSCKS